MNQIAFSKFRVRYGKVLFYCAMIDCRYNRRRSTMPYVCRENEWNKYASGDAMGWTCICGSRSFVRQ